MPTTFWYSLVSDHSSPVIGRPHMKATGSLRPAVPVVYYRQATGRGTGGICVGGLLHIWPHPKIGDGRFNGTMQNVVGPTLVAMVTKFQLGAEIQSPTGLSNISSSLVLMLSKDNNFCTVSATPNYFMRSRIHQKY